MVPGAGRVQNERRTWWQILRGGGGMALPEPAAGSTSRSRRWWLRLVTPLTTRLRWLSRPTVGCGWPQAGNRPLATSDRPARHRAARCRVQPLWAALRAGHCSRPGFLDDAGCRHDHIVLLCQFGDRLAQPVELFAFTQRAVAAWSIHPPPRGALARLPTHLRDHPEAGLGRGTSRTVSWRVDRADDRGHAAKRTPEPGCPRLRQAVQASGRQCGGGQPDRRGRW